jgi:hypothetical protein
VALGRAVNANWVRQTLRRARERFIDVLVAEVARSLESPTFEQLEQELIALGLGDDCRTGLERYPAHPGPAQG